MSTFDSQGNSIGFRPTTSTDVPFVMDAERHPDNAQYIGQWSEVRHEAAIASDDEAHFIIEAHSRPLGYLILTGIIDPHLAIHLKRIVIIEKGKGYGRQVLRWVKAYTFETLGCHRLWFDVIESNQRAKALYLSEGFTVEGRLRDGWKTANGYEDMLLLSMLQPEYSAPTSAQSSTLTQYSNCT